MRSAPETDHRKDSLRSIVENDPLITLWKAEATILAATDVSVSQQPVVLFWKHWNTVADK